MPKSTCELECPKCHKKWAVLKFEFEKAIRASDIKVTAGRRKKFKDGDNLACTLCGHEMTNWDIILSIHASGAANG